MPDSGPESGCLSPLEFGDTKLCHAKLFQPPFSFSRQAAEFAAMAAVALNLPPVPGIMQSPAPIKEVTGKSQKSFEQSHKEPTSHQQTVYHTATKCTTLHQPTTDFDPTINPVGLTQPKPTRKKVTVSYEAIANDDLLAEIDADSVWLEMTRAQKSKVFRHKRRQLNEALFGNPFKRKGAFKNVARQATSMKRKRDENGKFLWGTTAKPAEP